MDLTSDFTSLMNLDEGGPWVSKNCTPRPASYRVNNVGSVGTSPRTWLRLRAVWYVCSARTVIDCFLISCDSRCILLSNTWLTCPSPVRRVELCVTQCVSVYRVLTFLMSSAVFRCRSAVVAHLGSPAHLLRYWSVKVSSLSRCDWGRSWTVKRKRMDGKIYMLYISNLYSFLTCFQTFLELCSLSDRSNLLTFQNKIILFPKISVPLPQLKVYHFLPPKTSHWRASHF